MSNFTVKETSIYVTVLLMAYFIGVLFPLHYLCLFLISLMYLYMLNKFIKKRSVVILKVILLCLVMQNTFLGIGMHVFGISAKEIMLFSQISTIFIFMTAACIIFFGKKVKKHLAFVLYIFIIIYNFFVGTNHEIMVLLYNVRNFTVFYLAYTIGNYIIDGNDKFENIKNFIIKLGLFAGFFSVIGFITDGQLYVWCGAAEVSNLKTMDSGTGLFDGKLPSYFLGEFFGTFLVRAGSLYLEPVNFSSFMALAVILRAIKLDCIGDWIQLIFLLVCQVMTFGKGGLLITSIVLFSLCMYGIFYGRLKRDTVLNATKWFTISLIIIAGGVYAIFFPHNMHFYSIAITFYALLQNPLGFGLGSVGNVNRHTSGEVEDVLGSETGVLNIWCQLGIEGLIVFTYILYTMYKKNFMVYKDIGDRMSFIFTLMPVILYLVFIFQENIFTTQVITGYMFIIGAVAKCTIKG